MSLRDILRWPDPRLNMVCEPVTQIDADVATLAADMLETMYAAPGRGLAAPQVGEMWRVFVMDTEWKEGAAAPMVFINPAIVSHSEAQAVQVEGCLSIPGISAEISRSAEVVMTWQALSGAPQRRAFSGFAAACVQHELDHLNGVVTFDHLEPELRAEYKAVYVQAAP
ncbi:Peptide deformylase [Roseobacter fucihabitans]|uniref:Peptide deformylase n=1 Tax=Roseobacter fucihabitans TaxID=1537242 RepID=A0ABZ2BR56_9RHOB|nr:peptide deformylase [Roseobacter litoralis]MBC6964620.1 Peptide deformylase [Roseobacter litoralis]